MNIVWITGASTGIGFATAQEFINQKWKVIITSSNSAKLKNAKEKLLKNSRNQELYSFQCDITKNNEVSNVVSQIEKKIGPINLAILNAAAYSPNKNQDFDIENYKKLIDVNLKGTLFCIDALIKKMTNRFNSHIAIVSSPVGYRGLPTAGAYGLTKAGLINLAESLVFDLKKRKIKISVINPGFINTESTKLNTFPMPFIKTSKYAGKKIFKGLTNSYKFEIIFPWFFIFILKTLRILPYKIYFYLITKITKL